MGGGRNVEFQNYNWPKISERQNGLLVDQNVESQKDQNVENGF
jgi:hypothetical protein